MTLFFTRQTDEFRHSAAVCRLNVQVHRRRTNLFWIISEISRPGKELRTKEGAMKNFKKICQLLMLIALFSCLGKMETAKAVVVDQTCPPGYVYTSGTCVRMNADGSYNYKDTVKPTRVERQSDRSIHNNKNIQTLEERCPDGQTLNENTGQCEAVKPIGVQVEQPTGVVTGCTKNTGLFSGLINTGSKIFQGLRDLIYVVAGFGIIGVAVGGFFGNLNWKWLGAIVIALVVIASTGELITAITGCTDFTQSMITDTLK